MFRYWLLVAVAAGLFSAAVYLASLSGTLAGMILAYLAPAFLYAAGLGLGALAGGVAGLGGTLAAALTGGVATGLGYFLVCAVPAALLVRQAMLSRRMADGTVEWYPPGLLAAWLTGIGMAGLVVMSLLLLREGAGMEAAVHGFTLKVGDMLDAADPELFARMVTPLLPGTMIAVWLLMLTVNAALAQAALVGTGRNLRPSPDIAALELPAWPAPVGAAAALAGVLLSGDLGYFLRNFAVVMAVPFFLQGLGVIHVLSRRTAGGRPMLAIFYALLVVLGWIAMLITVLGLVEQLLGLRRRLSGAPNDGEG